MLHARDESKRLSIWPLSFDDMSTNADRAANLLDAIAVARCASGDVSVESSPHYSRAALGCAGGIAIERRLLSPCRHEA